MGIFNSTRSSILNTFSGSASQKDRQVTGKEDEEQLVRKFENWWQESESLQNKRLQWVKRNRDLYLGKHIQTPRPKSRSTTIHNKIFENVETIVPIMTENMPEPVVVVNSDDNDMLTAGRTVNNALIHLHRMDRLQIKSESIVRDMIINRDALVVMRFDPFKGKNGDITLEIAKPEHCRIDPNATPYDQGEYFFNAPLRSCKYVLERYPEHREHIMESFGVTEQELLENKKLDNLLELKEVWYWRYEQNEFNIWQAVYLNKKLLDNQRNPYWDFDGELNPEDEQAFQQELQRIEEIAVLQGEEAGKEVLEQVQEQFESRRRYRNFLEKQMFPYVLFPTFIDDNNPYSSTSLLEQVASLQFSLNERKQEIDENTKLVGKGQIVMDKNSGISKNQITNAAGAVYVKNPGTEFRREPGVPIPPQFFQDMGDTEQAIDNIFGANDISKGQQLQGATAREAILLKEADRGRVALLIRHFEASMELVYQWQIHLMKLFYSEPRTIMIANAFGVADSFQRMSNDDIPDDLQVYVKVGSAKPIDQTAKRAEVIAMYEKGQIDPISFFERLGDFKDPYKMAENLWKWQNGMLFQEPNVGPEQRAREAMQAILQGEKVQYDPEATLESIEVQARAIDNPAEYPFTSEQIAQLESKIQQERDMVAGKSQQRRADMQASRIPMDMAEQFQDVPQAQQAMDMM